jgi:branched-chain amino acid transport system permease protein
MAVGAYAMGLLVLKAHLSFWAALPLAAGVSICFAVVIGVPSLRLRGDYFAIATIAFSETIRYAIQNSNFTGGQQGLVGFDNTWQNLASRIMSALGLSSQYYLVPLLLVGLLVFIVALALIWALTHTPWGRVLRAVREDESAARALGKRVFVYKLQSLALAAVLASIAGYLLALDLGYLSADEFLPDNTFIAFTILLVGGLGSYVGILVGAVVVEALLEGTRDLGIPMSDARYASLRYIIVGAVLILIVVVRPQGIFGNAREMSLRR